jgi:hypothetical protein
MLGSDVRLMRLKWEGKSFVKYDLRLDEKPEHFAIHRRVISAEMPIIHHGAREGDIQDVFVQSYWPATWKIALGQERGKPPSTFLRLTVPPLSWSRISRPYSSFLALVEKLHRLADSEQLPLSRPRLVRQPVMEHEGEVKLPLCPWRALVEAILPPGLSMGPSIWGYDCFHFRSKALSSSLYKERAALLVRTFLGLAIERLQPSEINIYLTQCSLD